MNKGRNKKQITKKGYRNLAFVWALAAASMAVAVVRGLPVLDKSLVLQLGLMLLSLVCATNFWKAYKLTPQEDDFNHNSEEKKHER